LRPSSSPWTRQLGAAIRLHREQPAPTIPSGSAGTQSRMPGPHEGPHVACCVSGVGAESPGDYGMPQASAVPPHRHVPVRRRESELRAPRDAIPTTIVSVQSKLRTVRITLETSDASSSPTCWPSAKAWSAVDWPSPPRLLPGERAPAVEGSPLSLKHAPGFPWGVLRLVGQRIDRSPALTASTILNPPP
jgi:hypothetical protein